MNMFNSKNRNGEICILRNDFDKLCLMTYEQINEFLEFDLDDIKITSNKDLKGKAYIRIPNDITERQLNSEEDRMQFLFEIKLYTYGLSHRYLHYSIKDLVEEFNLEELKNKEFVLKYCNKEYGNIQIVHKRAKGIYIFFSNEELNLELKKAVPKEQSQEKSKLEIKHLDIKDIEKRTQEIKNRLGKQAIYDQEYIQLQSLIDSDYLLPF